MNRTSSIDSFIGAGCRNHNNNHNAFTDRISPHNRDISSDESDLQVRLARLSVGSAKPAKGILDDLLSSNEGGKNDYDWLLTPPGTPLFPSSQGKESQPRPVTARSKSSVRSSSVNKNSRLSGSQSESSYPSRPTRSSSATRASISTSQYTNYNRNTNILNTSSASVSSYIRPPTPTNRSSTSARPSTPSATRTTPSRGSTPSRTRPSPPTDKTIRPSQTTRPLTPTSRPQTPGNANPPMSRPVSRPTTPTRRAQTMSLAPSTTPGGRGLSSTPRTVGSGSKPGSRPGSPSARLRLPPQAINLPDFSHETPPNLRTTLPDRPLSAGRSRPSGSAIAKGSLEACNTGRTITRRNSSPIVTRGRVVDPTGSGLAHGNGHVVESLEPRRTSHLTESLTRKPVKSLNSENVTGSGRNILKKSLNMAIKHMDIRNGTAQALSGSTLFPQSIRSSNSRTQPRRVGSAPGSIDGSTNNGLGAENRDHINGYLWNRGQPVEYQSPPHSSKLSSEADIFESSRYDAILLQEDLMNTSWLHSADDKIDDGLLFDNGFEPLPEPFEPL